MEELSNISSEEELLQLRNEGKISEDEYEELLAAIRQPPLDDLTSRVCEPPDIPMSLKVVGWLFIISGICAVIEVVVCLMNKHININFGVLGLFIGPGLLKLRRGWRTCALVFLWIGLIGIPIVALIFLAAPASQLTFRVFGQPVSRIPTELALLFAIGAFLLVLWQYRVLTGRKVRALFGLSSC